MFIFISCVDVVVDGGVGGKDNGGVFCVLFFFG